MFALNQDHVRPMLGSSRFILARRRDVELIDHATATASAESNARIARFDPQGKGFCPETVAYDLVSLATRAIHQVRSGAGGSGPIGFTFKVRIGDYTFGMRGTQAREGGDIVAKVVGRQPSPPAEGPVDEAIIRAILGGRRVLVRDADGQLVDCSWIPFDQRRC